MKLRCKLLGFGILCFTSFLLSQCMNKPALTREEAAQLWAKVNAYTEQQRERNGKHGLPQIADLIKKQKPAK